MITECMIDNLKQFQNYVNYYIIKVWLWLCYILKESLTEVACGLVGGNKGFECCQQTSHVLDS